MDLIVVFEKIKINDFLIETNTLSEKIKQAARILNQDIELNPVKLRFVEGVLQGSPQNEEIVILISAAQSLNNLGQQIVQFKKEIIQIFSEYGISLDKNSLQVKTCLPETVDKIIATQKNQKNDGEFDFLERAKIYIPVEPAYSFDRVILPSNVLRKIEEAINILQMENKVFKEWGLYEIQPHPSTALSFYGDSGTGKTMAAEAIARKLGKKILKVSYADIESKYHGEGPKMVKAIFLAASNANAVLFFDEADSLLSKRLTNVTQGSEQAINSMRSQLLICLEEFKGVVIFATNLVTNYDQAFLTRLISVKFPLPDSETRKKIWDVHIKAPEDGKKHQLNIPLADNVDTMKLAEKYTLVGREIRNAVVSACVNVAMEGREKVEQKDFLHACDKILQEKEELQQEKDGTNLLKNIVNNKLKTIDTSELNNIDKN